MLEITLRPRDAGFDARAIGYRVLLPPGPAGLELRVHYLTAGGAPVTVTGTADACARTLARAGYLVGAALPTGREARLEADGWHVQPARDNTWMGPFATLAEALDAYNRTARPEDKPHDA